MQPSITGSPVTNLSLKLSRTSAISLNHFISIILGVLERVSLGVTRDTPITQERDLGAWYQGPKYLYYTKPLNCAAVGSVSKLEDISKFVNQLCTTYCEGESFVSLSKTWINYNCL